MANIFSYLNSPAASPLLDAPHITQQEETGMAATAATVAETFNKVAEADLNKHEGNRAGEWILPDPAQIPAGDLHQTPLDRLAMVAANKSPPEPPIAKGCRHNHANGGPTRRVMEYKSSGRGLHSGL